MSLSGWKQHWLQWALWTNRYYYRRSMQLDGASKSWKCWNQSAVCWCSQPIEAGIIMLQIEQKANSQCGNSFSKTPTLLSALCTVTMSSYFLAPEVNLQISGGVLATFGLKATSSWPRTKMIYYFYNNLSQIRLFDIVFSIEFIWNRKMLESQPFVCRHTTYKQWRCSQLKPLWTGFRNFMDTIFYVNPMQK